MMVIANLPFTSKWESRRRKPAPSAWPSLSPMQDTITSPLARQWAECGKASPVLFDISSGSTTLCSTGASGSAAVSTIYIRDDLPQPIPHISFKLHHKHWHRRNPTSFASGHYPISSPTANLLKSLSNQSPLSPIASQDCSSIEHKYAESLLVRQNCHESRCKEKQLVKRQRWLVHTQGKGGQGSAAGHQSPHGMSYRRSSHCGGVHRQGGW